MSTTTTTASLADIVRQEVTRISRNGKRPCHPRELVDVARDETHPLHGSFEWNDSVAGEAYRIEQARRMIRRVVIIDNTDAPAPEFVHVTRVDRRGNPADGYVPTRVALSCDDRSGVLADAHSQLRGIKRRFASLTELADVWQAIDDLDDEQALAA